MLSRLTALIALAALLSSAASAQLDLSWQGGLLGHGLRFQFDGDAPGYFVLLPSETAGPTPLSILDPSETRSLDVGTDLLHLLASGPLTGPDHAGAAVYHLPANPAFAGKYLRAQAFSLPGTASFVDDVSNLVGLELAPTAGVHSTPGPMVTPRRAHSATSTQDGRVLLAGGRRAGPPQEVLSTFEWYLEDSQTFASGSLLPGPRARHTATRLQDGRVLLVGGIDAGGALATCALVDPASGTAKGAMPMASPRVHHAAVLLPDGRVLVGGGSTASNPTGPLGAPASLSAGASPKLELYDPLLDLWVVGPALPGPTTGLAGALLPDGKVLLAGGVRTGPGAPMATAECFVFDPGTGGLTRIAPLPQPRAFAAVTPTLAGPIVLAGGARFPTASVALGSAASYVFTVPPGAPSELGSWSSGPTVGSIVVDGRLECVPRQPLPDPDNPFDFDTFPNAPMYWMAGGWSSVDPVAGTGTPSTTVRQLDAGLTAWKAEPPLLATRPSLAVAPLAKGHRMLVSGAPTGGTGVGSAEIHVTVD